MSDDENTNCLADMRCPNCTSPGPFNIEVISVALIYDDGVSDVGDQEWKDDSWCLCTEQDCEHQGRVSEFTFKMAT